ncbi:MAG TPA: AEC family transporter [Reyranella sp.]
MVATFAVGMASTRLVSRRTRKAGLAAMSLQGIAASWGNVGYMGVPLCLAAFNVARDPDAGREVARPFRRGGGAVRAVRHRAVPVGQVDQERAAGAGLATLIKLLLQPLLAALILPFVIDLGSVAGRVALLTAALPTAANTFVLAKQFDISVEQNTASVLLSTAFSVVTVSALLVWLRVS